MFKNNLKIAWRNLWKDREYSLINIFGLVVGITCSLFLILYVLDELSYDRYNEKSERMYRIVSYIQEPERDMKMANTQFPLGPVLQTEFPEVEQSVRVVRENELYYEVGQNQFSEAKIYYADENIFEVFTYPFIEGLADNALIEPNSMVLTESMAKKYFGSVAVIGQTIKNSRNELFTVSGVIADIPKNSHFVADAFIASKTLPEDFSNSWGQFGTYYTYVLLKPNTDPMVLQDKMLSLYDSYMAEIFEPFNVKIHYGVYPITSIHLKSDLEGEPEEIGSMSYIYIFTIVAFFMLLIASINYMNLTTARGAGRAKEIGIRKVVGSNRRQLVKQFILESILVTAIATLLSILMVILLLPYFNDISGKMLDIGILLNPTIVLVLAGIVFLVGFIGGSYPAIYLTGTSAINVLKGKLAKASSNAILRNGLVTVQFTISMVMLICTWVVYNQLDFMRDKDLGFNSEQIISMDIDPVKNPNGKLTTFKNEMKKRPEILMASISESAPGKDSNFNLFTVETNDGFIEKGLDVYGVDEAYFET